MKLSIIGATLVLAAGFASPSHAACDIKDFQTIDKGEMSHDQFWSYIYQLNKDQWDNLKTELNSGGSYFAITGHEEFSDIHDRAAKETQSISTTRSDDARKSWFTSALTPAGLNAYLACQGGGLTLAYEKLDAELSKVAVNYVPEVTLHRRFSLASSENIANAGDLNKQFKGIALDHGTHDFEAVVKLSDPKLPGYLTVQSGEVQKSVYIPPSQTKLGTPAWGKNIVIGKSSCSGAGTNDNVCDLLNQNVAVPAGISLSATLHLSAHLAKIDSDPHRMFTARITCNGREKAEVWAGHSNVDDVPDYVVDLAQSCGQFQDGNLNITVSINPRQGTRVDVVGADVVIQ